MALVGAYYQYSPEALPFRGSFGSPARLLWRSLPPCRIEWHTKEMPDRNSQRLRNSPPPTTIAFIGSLVFSTFSRRRPSWLPCQIECSTSEPLQSVEKAVRKASPLLEEAGGPQHANGQYTSLDWQAIPDIWRTTAENYGDRVALTDNYHEPPTQMTYKELEQAILSFSEQLQLEGISFNDKIALFAENSCRWLVADQGIMAIGAAGAVRGSKSSIEELIQIYNHSDSVALILDNPDLYHNLAPRLRECTEVKFILLLWGQKSSIVDNTFPVYTYDDFISKGQKGRAISNGNSWVNPVKRDNLATLVYTSGTTGNPKGVMLTHANLLHQVVHLRDIVQPIPGDRFLSLLPPWHMYERVAEYYALSCGVEQVYTNVKNLKGDLKNHKPDYFVSVPLVFDILYSGIQKQISLASNVRRTIANTFIQISMIYMKFKRIYEGKDIIRSREKPWPIIASAERLLAGIATILLLPFHLLGTILVYKKIHNTVGIRKAAISAGGSLPFYVDKFFEAIDIKLLNGYGLTEASPAVSLRPSNKNILGTVGWPLELVEVKIVHPESGENLPPGTKGLVKVRGPLVMKGYYKNLDATRKAIDDNGWLDTGDLGWLAPSNHLGAARLCGGSLVLDGREKDTIVLSTGENVEPTEVEEAAMRSKLIQQIMIVGQDKRRLGALIVANKDELFASASELIKSKGQLREPTEEDLNGVIRKELIKFTADCSIPPGPFILLNEPFTIKDQLGSYRRKEGIFGWPSAQADRTQTSASTWWEDYGADTPELQSLAIRILSQGCSSSPVERLWSTFGHITPKKRNRLGVSKANDLVFVNANKRLLRKMSFELSKERFIGLENPLPTNSDNEEADDFPDSHVDDEDDLMDLPEGLDDDVIEPEAEPDFDHDDE